METIEYIIILGLAVALVAVCWIISGKVKDDWNLKSRKDDGGG